MLDEVSDAELIVGFLQGAGGVFALIGAIYLVSTYMPASRAATMIGVTQMFGMAGGSAGQFVVGPIIGSGVAWNQFWIAMGVFGLLIGVALYFLIPDESSAQTGGGLKPVVQAFVTVFKNPQSILCGLIAGLMFIPTTIFDIVRRGMPFMAPRTLTDDQVYAITAYLLAINKLIDEKEVMNAQKLFEREGWQTIDVSRRSIEETAAAILNLLAEHRERRGA